MLWRIQDTGVDWIAAIMGLAFMGILVIAGLEFHYELCHVQCENDTKNFSKVFAKDIFRMDFP